MDQERLDELNEELANLRRENDRGQPVLRSAMPSGGGSFRLLKFVPIFHLPAARQRLRTLREGLSTRRRTLPLSSFHLRPSIPSSHP